MISVIICSITPEKYEAVCASYTRCLADTPHEIVGIHDARSLCEGYNHGIERARGDVLVFSHDDVQLLAPALGSMLRRHLQRADVIGVAGTTRQIGMGWASSGIRNAHGIVTHVVDDRFLVSLYGVTAPLMLGMQSVDGVFFAVSRDAADAIRFDEDTFDGWHGYDADFTFRCHLTGLRVAVASDIPLVHHSSGSADAAWLEYDARFRAKHGLPVQGPYGRWLDVTMSVKTTEDVRGAYELQPLLELTKTIRARVENEQVGAMALVQ